MTDQERILALETKNSALETKLSVLDAKVDGVKTSTDQIPSLTTSVWFMKGGFWVGAGFGVIFAALLWGVVIPNQAREAVSQAVGPAVKQKLDEKVNADIDEKIRNIITSSKSADALIAQLSKFQRTGIASDVAGLWFYCTNDPNGKQIIKPAWILEAAGHVLIVNDNLLIHVGYRDGSTIYTTAVREQGGLRGDFEVTKDIGRLVIEPDGSDFQIRHIEGGKSKNAPGVYGYFKRHVPNEAKIKLGPDLAKVKEAYERIDQGLTASK